MSPAARPSSTARRLAGYGLLGAAGEGHGQSPFRIVPALVRMAADFAQRYPG